MFLSWRARPDRTEEWYEAQKREVLARTGTLDDLWQEYPETDAEALAARVADTRFRPEWVEQCREEAGAGEAGRSDAPAIPGLEVFEPPRDGARYVIGADPAQGNPQSDDSALTVLEIATRSEVASLAGKFDPSVFAGHVGKIATWYNHAGVLVERNNHGHAMILALREWSSCVSLLTGMDNQDGWLTTPKSKVLAYDHAADCLRDGKARVRSRETLAQLAAIQGATLRAPEGQHDDRAMSFVLALAAIKWCGAGSRGLSAYIRAPDVIDEIDRAGW